MLYLLPVLIAFFAASADAQKVGVRSKLGFGCFNSALKWDFDCPAVYLPFDCRCTKEDFLTTAMYCVRTHAAGTDEVVAGYQYIRDQCHYWGSRTMSIQDMDTIYQRNVDRVVSPNSFNATGTIAPGPVAVPEILFAHQMVAASNTKYHYHVGNCFGWGIIGYWGLIMAGAVLTNAIRVVDPNFYERWSGGKVSWVRKKLTLPALVGSKHHSPWRFSKYLNIHAPTRGQALIIFGFLVLNVASIVSFFHVEGDTPLSFTSKQDRILHYMANRTGIVAFAHIPLIVLFACRNNPFIWLSGWPYDTFMTYHRWAARCMAIQAITHGIMMYWSSANEKVIMYKWHHVHNWRGGNIAVYMVIIMLTMALRMIRSRIYEIFKFTHVLMFLIFIICLVVHCSDYGWLAWLWTALAFYGIEYISRISRQILSGGIQDAECTLTSAGMYRITVKGGKRRWKINPGAYVYIRFFEKDLFWQEHPFSIFQSPTGKKDDSLDLCCKAQSGATQKLLQRIANTSENRRNFKVAIEGPYGNENYVSNYDSVLLFAGGVGFTAVFSFASSIIENMKEGQFLYIVWVVRSCSTIEAFASEVSFLLKKQSEKACNFRIFVTSPGEINLGTVEMSSYGGLSPRKGSLHTSAEEPLENSESLSNSNSELKSSSPVDLGKYEAVESSTSDSETVEQKMQRADSCHIVLEGSVVKPEFRRPGVSVEVCDFIKTAQGSKAVCSCGPPMFLDAIRGGIVSSIMDSSARVDYFEDAFSW